MPTDDNKIRAAKRTKKRDPIFSLPDNSDITIARPSAKIALDCRQKTNVANSPGQTITEESLIQTFNNGWKAGYKACQEALQNEQIKSPIC